MKRSDLMLRLKFTPILAIAIMAGCTSAAPTPPPKPAERWDDRPIGVSEVRYPALEAAIKEQRGKVIVLDMWALWCDPCKKNFPHLVDIQKKYLDRSLVCFGVSRDKDVIKDYDKSKVLDFLNKNDARFPNFVLDDFVADEPELKKNLHMGDQLPFMAVIDREGKVVWNTEQHLKDFFAIPEELDAFLDQFMNKK